MNNNKFFFKVILFSTVFSIFAGCSVNPTIGIEVEEGVPKFEAYHAKAMKALGVTNPDSTYSVTYKGCFARCNSKGPVKSIRSVKFKVIKKDGEFIKGDTVRYEHDTNIFTKYNRLGYAVERKEYRLSKLDSHVGYIYLDNERITVDYKKGRKVIATNIYDNFGNWIMNCSYHPTGGHILFYNHNEKGERIELAMFDNNKQFIKHRSWKTFIEYDEDQNDQGFVYEKRNYDVPFDYENKASYLRSRSFKTYNKDCKLTKYTYTNYNEKGETPGNRGYKVEGLNTKFYLRKDGKFDDGRKNEFVYDKQGNWIKSTSFKGKKDLSFEPINIIERKITYYSD